MLIISSSTFSRFFRHDSLDPTRTPGPGEALPFPELTLVSIKAADTEVLQNVKKRPGPCGPRARSLVMMSDLGSTIRPGWGREGGNVQDVQ